MLIRNCQAIQKSLQIASSASLTLGLCSGERDLEVVCDMLPVTVSPGVFKTLNDRQSEFNKKCEAIKQILWITSQTLGVLLVYAGLRDVCGT